MDTKEAERSSLQVCGISLAGSHTIRDWHSMPFAMSIITSMLTAYYQATKPLALHINCIGFLLDDVSKNGGEKAVWLHKPTVSHLLHFEVNVYNLTYTYVCTVLLPLVGNMKPCFGTAISALSTTEGIQRHALTKLAYIMVT